MRTLLAIAVMGALGALGRHGLGTLVKSNVDSTVPAATLAVNVLGCFLLGLLTGLAISRAVPEPWRGPLAIGFLGSFTTFSTFGLETVLLAERGQWAAAAANVALQLALGFTAAGAGLYLGRQLILP